jgi:hypothetical protein
MLLAISFLALCATSAGAFSARAASSSRRRDVTQEASKFRERIESMKFAAVGGIAASVGAAPVGLVLHAGELAQWEFETDSLVIMGALYALIARYADRDEGNPFIRECHMSIIRSMCTFVTFVYLCIIPLHNTSAYLCIHLCIPLYTSVYLCIPLHTSVYLCITIDLEMYTCLRAAVHALPSTRILMKGQSLHFVCRQSRNHRFENLQGLI